MPNIFDTEDQLKEVASIRSSAAQITASAQTIRAAGNSAIAIRAAWLADGKAEDVAELDAKTAKVAALLAAVNTYLA